MSDSGTTAYSPNAKFAFPRSYVRGIQISIAAAWECIDTGNPMRFHYDGGWYQQYIDLHILPQFFEWNSNGYTLDFVFDNMFTYYDFDPTPNHFANTVGWSSGGEGNCNYIHVLLPGSSYLFQVNLPDPPDDYWLPQAPCGEILS